MTRIESCNIDVCRYGYLHLAPYLCPTEWPAQMEHANDLTADDLPRIESPFFARGKVEDALTNGHLSRNSVWGLDRWVADYAHGSGSGRRASEERLLKDVAGGHVALVCSGDHGKHDGPFSPLVEWQSGGEGGRWVPRLRPWEITGFAVRRVIALCESLRVGVAVGGRRGGKSDGGASGTRCRCRDRRRR